MKVGGQTQIPIIGRHNTLIRTNNGLLNGAFGGWLVSGVVQVFRGLPMTVTTSDVSNTGAFHGGRANRSCNAMNFPGRSQKEWFNTACYSQPAVYQFGSAPRNDLIGPKVTSTALSLFKTFPFGETRSVIFRVDAFDPFNESWNTNPTLTLNEPQLRRRRYWRSAIPPTVPESCFLRSEILWAYIATQPCCEMAIRERKK